MAEQAGEEGILKIGDPLLLNIARRFTSRMEVMSLAKKILMLDAGTSVYSSGFRSRVDEGDTHLLAFEVLQEWCRKAHPRPYISELVTTLREIDCDDIASMLERHMRKEFLDHPKLHSATATEIDPRTLFEISNSLRSVYECEHLAQELDLSEAITNELAVPYRGDPSALALKILKQWQQEKKSATGHTLDNALRSIGRVDLAKQFEKCLLS